MPAGSVTGLYDLCAEFLAACAAAVELAPGGAIDRAYVSPGPPAWDCAPQLTVHAGGPIVGDTMPFAPPLEVGHRIQNTGIVNLATMTATVLRCSPVPSKTGIAPTPASLDAAAQQTLGDVWAIWNYLASRKRSSQLWAPRERELVFDPAVALGSQGGASGWQVQIRVQIDGYTP